MKVPVDAQLDTGRRQYREETRRKYQENTLSLRKYREETIQGGDWLWLDAKTRRRPVQAGGTNM
jgi:hypothetical protein